jgi:hypothetical protein
MKTPSFISIVITLVIIFIAGMLFLSMPSPSNSCQEAYSEPMTCQAGEYNSNGICCPKNMTNVNGSCVSV